jgi:predicted permease
VRPARSTSPYRSPQARSCCRRPTLAILEASKAPAGGQKNPGVVLRAVGRSLVKPIVLAPLACVVFSLLGVPLAEAVSRSFQSIGEAAGGVALFVTGLILSAQRIELGPSVLSGALLKNVLHPLSVFGLILALPTGRASAVRSALRLLVRLALRPQLPPSHRELCQSCVEDAAADVVKEDVDPFGAPLL